jgi:hypothetical protein
VVAAHARGEVDVFPSHGFYSWIQPARLLQSNCQAAAECSVYRPHQQRAGQRRAPTATGPQSLLIWANFLFADQQDTIRKQYAVGRG